MEHVALDEDEQKRVAMGLFLDAWDEACETGVSADLLAEVLMYLALTDLVADRGEDAVADIVAGLPSRIRAGEFTLGNDDEDGGPFDDDDDDDDDGADDDGGTGTGRPRDCNRH